MSHHNTSSIKTEESPATEALDYLLQNETPNSLMFDLSELLQRDPTLSSLTAMKNESDNLLIHSGLPIPTNNKRPSPIHISTEDTPLNLLPDLEETLGGGHDQDIHKQLSSSAPFAFGQSMSYLRHALAQARSLRPDLLFSFGIVKHVQIRNRKSSHRNCVINPNCCYK